MTIDPDGQYFRITPTEVRLVTDKARQYYPIGYLVKGRRFEALPLDSGHLIDDYNREGTVIEDWVFEIDEDEHARWIEMKELARESLAGVVGEMKNFKAAPTNRYPQVAYKAESSDLTVNLQVGSGTITEARVYVLVPTIAQQDIAGEATTAYRKAVAILNGSMGWPNEPPPGVPSINEFRGVLDAGRDVVDVSSPTFGWSQITRLLLLGQATTDGAQNLTTLTRYIDDTLDKLWRRPPTVMRASSDTVDASGKLELTKIPNTTLTIFAMARTDKALYVWVVDQEFTANSHPQRTFTPDQAYYKIVLP